MNAKDLIKHYEGRKADRGMFDSQWQEIADYIVPNRATILSGLSPGQKLTTKLYDSTAYDANIILALWLSGSLTSMASDWFSLRIGGDSEEETIDDEGKIWLEAQKKKLMSSLRASNFSSQIDSAYIDWSAFGNILLFGDEKQIKKPGFNGFHFECIAPGTYVVDQDAEGNTVFVGREFELSANAALSKWGDKVGPKIATAAEKDSVQMFPFLHVVYPSDWFGNSKKTHPVMSDYINMGDKTIVSRGGYFEMCYFHVPWVRVSGEKYGRGPGHIALPDVKTLNKAEEFSLKGWSKALDPAVEILESGLIGTISLLPGSKNIVSIRDTVKPIQDGIQWDVNSVEREQKRETIRRIFHNDKIMMLPRPNERKGDMTAFEVSIRYELAQKLLGSPFNNLVTMGLNNIIERCFSIMYRGGALDPPPDSIIRASKAGKGQIDIQYESPLARAQRLEQVDSMNKLFGFLGAIPPAEQRSEAWDGVDIDEGVRAASEIMGVPPKVTRSKEKLQQFREKKSQAAQEQQGLDQAGQVSEMASKLMPAMKDMPPDVMSKMMETLGKGGA